VRFLQRPLVSEVDLRQEGGDQLGLGDRAVAVHAGQVQGGHADLQHGQVGREAFGGGPPDG
jgi:hypothetical protein